MLVDQLLPSFKPITTTCATPRATHDGKQQRKLEEEEQTVRRGTCSRSLMPLQPSKLRLFLSHTNSSAPTSQPSDGINASGLKLKAFGSGSSRLPKPKSH
ncbi:hypothetical protein ILYODFUR_019545 [Ilyodon furcidens]|uniref:Uncharacterized protein n=1 Tax=Ilyodon furcidens TaxID=33524 RepID=A0ABV0SZT9_9TELE